MFGNSKQEIEKLNQKIDKLEKNIGEIKERYDFQIETLKKQLAAVVSGLPVNPASIFSSLPYLEIPKEEVPSFIHHTPHLLILDVRGDEGWSQGHIPNAKHIPAQQVYQRLMELSDKSRPILTVCANGNTGVSIAQMLAKEGFRYVFNALGGMAGYNGELVKPQIQATVEAMIQGDNRELIRKVVEVIDRDVRPGLKRDGGDLKILAVENGVVKVKMIGACLGCGAQKRTVEEGIKTHLTRLIPEIQEVEDHS